MTEARSEMSPARRGAIGYGGTVHNLADFVRVAAVRRPDKLALVGSDRQLTWRGLDAAADRFAAALRARGLAAGDRVALVLGNTVDFPICYLGALRGGFVAVPINPAYTRDEFAHLLADSGARAAVGRPDAAVTLVGLTGELPDLAHVFVGEGGGAGAAPADAPTLADTLAATDVGPVEAVGGGADLAVLLYTSGTSGRPKGAMLSHRALVANLEQCAEIEPPVATADDLVLLVVPLFHIFGLNAALGPVVQQGATGLLVEQFDPVETLRLIARDRVTTVVGAPPVYVAWSMLPELRGAFGSVRLAVSGAAPLPATVLRRVQEVTGRTVLEGYGLTETAPVLTSTACAVAGKPGSIGRPVPGVELRLVDEDGGPAEPGDPGEIVVRGPNLFAGYWPDGSGGPDGEGWFRTGDVAYQDDDGDLHLVDRRRELVLVSGFSVYPREVEEVLLRHPDVREAAVLGVAHPYTGEAVKAIVVPRPGARPSAQSVVDHCARSLARFKCPTTVEFAASLPLSVTGKVSKGRLREMRAEPPSPD